MSTEDETMQVAVKDEKPIDEGNIDPLVEGKDVDEKPIKDEQNGEDENPEAEEKEKAEENVEEKTEENFEGKAEEEPQAAATNVRKKGSKFDPSVLPESNDPEEIRKQVEFYFSDSNLRWDRYLFSIVGKENKWVPLKIVASFKRMQRFKDFSAIQAALGESEMLELNPAKLMVRRKVPLDLNVDQSKIKEIQDRAQSRSLYAKGFGEETPTTQIDIEKHFEPYGPINAVRLRRDDRKVFKGSVFVEFKSDELMEKFVALEEKPKYNDQELVYMRKKDYVEMKIQDIKDGKVQPQDRKTHRKRGGQFDALRIADSRPHNHGEKDSHKNDKRENGRGGRGGRGRRGRGGRGGRGGKRGNDRNGDRNGNADDEHSIPKVQASGEQGTKGEQVTKDEQVTQVEQVTKGEQGTKRQREDVGEADNAEKKVKVETETTA